MKKLPGIILLLFIGNNVLYAQTYQKMTNTINWPTEIRNVNTIYHLNRSNQYSMAWYRKTDSLMMLMNRKQWDSTMRTMNMIQKDGIMSYRILVQRDSMQMNRITSAQLVW